MKKRVKLVKIFCLGFVLLFFISNCLEKAKAEENKSCAWFGTAFICAGECPPDWTEVKRSSCNNEIEGCGSRCYFGSKAYCCRK